MRAHAAGAAPWYRSRTRRRLLTVHRPTGGTLVEQARGSTVSPLYLTEPFVLPIDLVALFT